MCVCVTQHNCGCCCCRLRCSMAEQRLARKYDYLRVLPSTMHPALVLFLRRFQQDDWFDRMPHVIWDRFAYSSRANFRDTRLIELDYWSRVEEVD